jgi:hypothetical protein
MKWGLLDTIDNVWMGNNLGPVTYEEFFLARLAATVLNERFGTLNRYQPREYHDAATRKRDEVTPILSFEDALKRIEDRTK